ncbi:MAG TPA: hypothetical protein VNH84_00260 [Candidatus Saccharimonadales bacterium]|nr:hypothetical protein [Candidatus Saccharimonadales bacterium]
MSDELSTSEVETLKERFRAAGCAVTDLDGLTFEIVGSAFPLRTHVSVNPYYVQLATYIFASPRGFFLARKSKLHEYLSGINRNAKLAKFTLERDAPPTPKGVWPIFASVKLVTGVAGGDYQADALKNLVLLWLQDIAALIAAPGDFELHAMMKEEESNDG